MASHYCKALHDLFMPHANKDRAAKMEAYMKHRFKFYGIMAAERRELSKQAIANLGTPNDFIAVVKELFEQPYRELHYFAQELMYRVRKQWDRTTIHDLEWLITHGSWWDTVDYIASTLIGHYFKTYPDQRSEYLTKWNASDDMWLVRTTILHQLKYKKDTDPVILRDMIIPHTDDTEFFIKKSIGWALREYAKTNEGWVREFVESHTLQPLSVKEALKNI